MTALLSTWLIRMECTKIISWIVSKHHTKFILSFVSNSNCLISSIKINKYKSSIYCNISFAKNMWRTFVSYRISQMWSLPMKIVKNIFNTVSLMHIFDSFEKTFGPRIFKNVFGSVKGKDTPEIFQSGGYLSLTP